MLQEARINVRRKSVVKTITEFLKQKYNSI